jgi:hypothetical protein
MFQGGEHGHIRYQMVDPRGFRPAESWVRVPDVKQAGLAQVVIVTNTGFSPVDVDRAPGGTSTGGSWFESRGRH